MKKIASVSAILLLAACGGPIVATPGQLTFVSRDTGIEGSYDPTTHSKSRVQSRVGELACKLGRLSQYSEQSGESGTVSFLALCDGENTYVGTAGFTLSGPQATGRVTASVDGQLVQIPLN